MLLALQDGFGDQISLICANEKRWDRGNYDAASA